MKKILSVPVVILKTKSGYNAFSPLVDGCAVTDRTIDRTFRRMEEALEFHFEGERLVKNKSKKRIKATLRNAFDDYGTDALYAAIRIAA